MGLRERLGKEWLFCDGGTGSILQKLGLKGGELPELWNLNRPEDIKNLNKSYFEAGSNIVNTFFYRLGRAATVSRKKTKAQIRILRRKK